MPGKWLDFLHPRDKSLLFFEASYLRHNELDMFCVYTNTLLFSPVYAVRPSEVDLAFRNRASTDLRGFQCFYFSTH